MKQFLISVLLLCSLTVNATTKQRDVIYGEDNRKDVYETTSSLYLDLAKSTAAMIPHGAIQNNTVDTLRLSAPTLMERGICAKEKFSNQLTAANCSGFLVGPNLLATAGHCIRSEYDCSSYAWVFDYNVKSPTQVGNVVPRTSVYRCVQVVRSVLDQTTMNDFAIVRLDRIVDRQPVKLKTTPATVGTKLVVIGHPTGLPTKVSDGAAIRQLRGTHFAANLDTYGGNSGSAVFNADTGEVEGILVRGENDYVRDPSGCMVSNRCPDFGCRGEDVTYATMLNGLVEEAKRKTIKE